MNCGNATFYKVGSATTATPTGTNLIGTFSDNTEVPNGSYILSGGKWKKSNGSAKVNANRAYLTLTKELEVPSAGARVITMGIGDDETTGLMTIDNGQDTMSNVIYDLQGRQVDQPTKKGIYVKNGKKYIVK